MTENNARCKYACARALLCMPVSKRRCISCKIQKSVAFAGSHFCGENGITLICAI